jgi:uncharacterized protein
VEDYTIETVTATLLAQMAAVTFAAAVVQGAAGFGFGLLATPVIMTLVGASSGVPLVTILSLVTCTALTLKVHTSVDRRVVARIAAGGVVGLPVGLFVFQRADEQQLLVTVSIVVLLFTGYLLAKQRGTPRREAKVPRVISAAGIGVLSSAMTMALSMPGPPVMLYLTVLRTPKDVLRATALCVFGLVYAAALVLQVTAVGIPSGVWVSGAMLIPVALGGVWVGDRLFGRVGEEAFRTLVLGLIGVAGVTALGSAFF